MITDTVNEECDKCGCILFAKLLPNLTRCFQIMQLRCGKRNVSLMSRKAYGSSVK